MAGVSMVQGSSALPAQALRLDRTRPHVCSAVQLAAFDTSRECSFEQRIAVRWADRIRSASAVTRASVQVAGQALVPLSF